MAALMFWCLNSTAAAVRTGLSREKRTPVRGFRVWLPGEFRFQHG